LDDMRRGPPVCCCTDAFSGNRNFQRSPPSPPFLVWSLRQSSDPPTGEGGVLQGYHIRTRLSDTAAASGLRRLTPHSTTSRVRPSSRGPSVCVRTREGETGQIFIHHLCLSMNSLAFNNEKSILWGFFLCSWAVSHFRPAAANKTPV